MGSQQGNEDIYFDMKDLVSKGGDSGLFGGNAISGKYMRDVQRFVAMC